MTGTDRTVAPLARLAASLLWVLVGGLLAYGVTQTVAKAAALFG
jgi:hypothetical protein